MKRYVLNYYDGHGEDGVYGISFEHEDEDVVVTEALRRSSRDSGKYTYRIEEWQGNRIVCSGFRYFQNGFEFTNDIKKPLLDIMLGVDLTHNP